MKGTVTIPVEEFERLRFIESNMDTVRIVKSYVGFGRQDDEVSYVGKDAAMRELEKTIKDKDKRAERQREEYERQEREIIELRKKPEIVDTSRPFFQRLSYLFTNVLPEAGK